MGVLEQIKDRIGSFAGYQTGEGRRLADEQIRAFVGERLSALPAESLDALGVDDRSLYDRALLRCEFLNQAVFAGFEAEPTPVRIEALLDADARLLDAAGKLPQAPAQELPALFAAIEAALGQRESAMKAE